MEHDKAATEATQHVQQTTAAAALSSDVVSAAIVAAAFTPKDLTNESKYSTEIPILSVNQLQSISRFKPPVMLSSIDMPPSGLRYLSIPSSAGGEYYSAINSESQVVTFVKRYTQSSKIDDRVRDDIIVEARHAARGLQGCCHIVPSTFRFSSLRLNRVDICTPFVSCTNPSRILQAANLEGAELFDSVLWISKEYIICQFDILHKLNMFVIDDTDRNYALAMGFVTLEAGRIVMNWFSHPVYTLIDIGAMGTAQESKHRMVDLGVKNVPSPDGFSEAAWLMMLPFYRVAISALSNLEVPTAPISIISAISSSLNTKELAEELTRIQRRPTDVIDKFFSEPEIKQLFDTFYDIRWGRSKDLSPQASEEECAEFAGHLLHRLRPPAPAPKLASELKKASTMTFECVLRTHHFKGNFDGERQIEPSWPQLPQPSMGPLHDPNVLMDPTRVTLWKHLTEAFSKRIAFDMSESLLSMDDPPEHKSRRNVAALAELANALDSVTESQIENSGAFIQYYIAGAANRIGRIASDCLVKLKKTPNSSMPNAIEAPYLKNKRHGSKRKRSSDSSGSERRIAGLDAEEADADEQTAIPPPKRAKQNLVEPTRRLPDTEAAKMLLEGTGIEECVRLFFPRLDSESKCRLIDSLARSHYREIVVAVKPHWLDKPRSYRNVVPNLAANGPDVWAAILRFREVHPDRLFSVNAVWGSCSEPTFSKHELDVLVDFCALSGLFAPQAERSQVGADENSSNSGGSINDDDDDEEQ